MNDHERNSALCGHLLVAWALGLNAVALFSCPSSFRLTHLLGVVLAALALACAWAAEGARGEALAYDEATRGLKAAGPISLAGSVFTFLSWLALVVGVISRG